MKYPYQPHIEEIFLLNRSFASVNKCLLVHGFKKLGSGDGRSVYLLDESTVIKVAKNKRGLEQNSFEIDCLRCLSDNIPVLIDYCNNSRYIIVEKVNKFKSEKHFEALLEFSYEVYFDACNALQERKFKEFYSLRLPSCIKDILLELNGLNVQMWDLKFIGNLGYKETEDGTQLIFIDLGLSNDIYKRYYRKVNAYGYYY